MALDSQLRMVSSGWLEGADHKEICMAAVTVAEELQASDVATVIAGIDAPRRPLSNPRKFYRNGRRDSWRPRKPAERGYGRHCEIIIKAAGIANPQWTPIQDNCPEWMEVGFALFTSLEREGITCHEVFPSASYKMLEGGDHAPISLNFSAFRPGPKDMIDACIAAYTVAEFENGRGCEVGNDGLGTIILPRPLPDIVSPMLLQWPE